MVREFDRLQVTPPQDALDFIKTSPLANEAGRVAIDPATLRHNAAGTAKARTEAAVRPQAPVVVRDLLLSLDATKLSAMYDGYGKMVVAEFAYGGKVTPGFLPYLYWNWMLKGREFDIEQRERSLAKAA